MIVKYLDYGVYSNKPKWLTGIALTNRTLDFVHVGVEFYSEYGKLLAEKYYPIKPKAMYAFMPPENIDRFSCVLWCEKDFGLTKVFGNNDFGFEIDSFPDTFSPPLGENNSSKITWLKPSYYMSIAGQLNCLPEKYATALRHVFRWFFLKTGIIVPVIDLNTCDGSQPSGHPDGFHTFRDVDIAYTDWINDWLLMKKILDVFPESVIMIDSSYWNKLSDEMLTREVKKYGGRIIKDTMPEHWHKTHYHIGLGGPINWEASK